VASDTQKAFYEAKNTGFAAPDPRDEYFHPQARERERGAELTETQYFGFNIPEERIHALCYIWHHPNLGVVSGGAWVWKGVKTNSLGSELFDILTYVDDAYLGDNPDHLALPNGYEVDIAEPLKSIQLRYADAQRGNAFDLAVEALAPPMVLETGFHFEQPVRIRGNLMLAGADYAVDGCAVRDRSWGQLRREVHMTLPPMTWMTGVFSADLSFGTTAFDSTEPDRGDPNAILIPGGDPLRGGWIWRDGAYSPVVAVEKRTTRNPTTLFPESVELKITDATGYELDLRGTILAASNWRAWHNMDSVICLVRWESEEGVAHGDFQDVLMHEWTRARLAGLPTECVS
jgi:hypothetical protein